MATENNKIIAEFMEVKIVGEVYYILSQFTYCNFETDFYTRDQYNAKDLKYNEDWNWLMEVVQKIESLGYGMDIQNLGVHINTFEGTKLRYNRFFLCESSKIQVVYNACIEFIKWYNQNRKEN